MKTIVFSLSMILGVMSSCQKEDTTDPKVENGNDVVDGIMKFSSEKNLNDYVQNIENQLGNNQRNSRVVQTIIQPKGFISLASSYSSYSGNSNLRIQEGGDSDAEVEEVINDNLIPLKALHYVLDTARRVIVGDKVYQITEAGTFAYSNIHTNEFNQLYENFIEKYLSYSGQVDS